MTLDEQISVLVKEHELSSLSITVYRSGEHTWSQVSVQWEDTSKAHGRGIASGEHGTDIKDGMAQALGRADAERRPALAVVPVLEGI